MAPKNIFLSFYYVLSIVYLANGKPTLLLDKPTDITENDAEIYLTRFGYLSKPNTNTNNTLTTRHNKSEIEQGLTKFQNFMGLPETSILDDATKEAMKKPRCDHEDNDDGSAVEAILTTRGRRKRRLAALLKNVYGSLDITYTWTVPKKYGGNSMYHHVWMLDYAFNIWAAKTRVLFFNRYFYLQVADVMVYFFKRDHGDGQNFDGPGRSWGHTNAQIREIHLDDDEKWATHIIHQEYWKRPGWTPDFIQLVAHEVGHLLGLSHSSKNTSVMYPTPDGGVYDADYALDVEDVTRIQATYGKCWSDRFDSIFSDFRGDGRTYIIVGPLVYHFNNKMLAVENAAIPRALYPYFGGGFQLVDDIFLSDPNIGDGKYHLMYFFRGWYGYDLFNNFASFPQRIGLNTEDYSPYYGWPGLDVDKIDAGFRHIDDRVYIFRKNLVYRWDYRAPAEANIPSGHVEKGWPKNISDVFPGLPNDIDTAFRWNYDGNVYFFKGQYFYIWSQKKNKAEGVYSTDQWKDVCDVIKCTQVTNTYCRSHAVTVENCGKLCENV